MQNIFLVTLTILVGLLWSGAIDAEMKWTATMFGLVADGDPHRRRAGRRAPSQAALGVGPPRRRLLEHDPHRHSWVFSVAEGFSLPHRHLRVLGDGLHLTHRQAGFHAEICHSLLSNPVRYAITRGTCSLKSFPAPSLAWTEPSSRSRWTSPPACPAFYIVGLPDTAVQEAKERVRSAIRNSGLHFPQKRITVNLAPADIRKEGPAYDLPIAVGILIASEPGRRRPLQRPLPRRALPRRPGAPRPRHPGDGRPRQRAPASTPSTSPRPMPVRRPLSKA